MGWSITWELWGAVFAIIGTHIATTGLLMLVVRWCRDDQVKIEERMDAGFAEFRSEMREFHREHSEMNKRIMELQLSQKQG